MRNLCESVFTPRVFIVKVLQVLFDYFDVSSFLSDAFWLPFQSRDKVQREIGICLWRVELAEKWFNPFWLESCPCKITPAGVWKRERFCIFLKCYCHSTQRNISHFKFEESDCSLCDTLLPQRGGRRINCRQMSLVTVFMTCPHGCLGFEVSHHPQVLCFIIPTAGKQALFTSSEPPFPWFKDYYFLFWPPKNTIVYTLYMFWCRMFEFLREPEESQLTPQKVTQRPFWPKTENSTLTIPGQIKSTQECPDW